jgi:hypothetical protein
VNPWDLFNPANFNPLDPQQLMGQVDASRLVAAAQSFPGGPAVLVFALFWAPVGPGIPAGVLLARHVGLNPLITITLYALSDVLGACVCHPLFAGLRRLARRVPALRWLGQRLMKVAMFGARMPTAEDLQVGVKGLAPALFRIGTVGFGLDVYHGGMLVAGLPVPRILGWGAAISGDLVWFALLLVTSIATAAVVDDDRVQFVVMLVAMFVLPYVAKRLFPVLRDPPRTPPVPTVPVPAAAQQGVPVLNGTVKGTLNGTGHLQPALAVAAPDGQAVVDPTGHGPVAAAGYFSRPPIPGMPGTAPTRRTERRREGRAAARKAGRPGKKSRGAS